MSESQMQELMHMCTKINATYKTLKDDVSKDKRWIHNNSGIVIDAPCEYIWDLYCKDFADEKILSKFDFYKLVRHELNVKSMVVRITDDTTKYCFRKKLSKK